MSSQVRAGRFKGVENRGVADMPRSGESLRFVDQQTMSLVHFSIYSLWKTIAQTFLVKAKIFEG